MGKKIKSKKYGSILVVDDDPNVLEATSLLLNELGYDVISSSDAKDAIVKFQAGNIDVVLTDIVMPSVSGIELLRQLHDMDSQVPVILMTAFADMEKVIDAIKIGAFDFIIKPFTAKLMVHSIEKAVNYNNLMKMEKDYKRLLEEFNQEIETLVAERTMSLMALTVADKIRNPAAVIGLTCKRVLDKENVPEKLRPKLRNIMEEAEKLDNIVENFQSLLESRKSMFRYFDINKVIESAVSINANKTAEKGIALVYSPSKDTLKINIQKNLFQIAISHLIRNSIEATPEGGKISVLIYEEDSNAVITISDTGRGISKKEIKKIFDPMFSTKEQRFGMGLALVKRIVSEHMGEIDVDSSSGRGTTFRIKLPFRWAGKRP